MTCVIPANADISGIGVRVAIYTQNLLVFVPAFYALVDGKVDPKELETVESLSTTILVTAFAILISTIIQARTTYGLSDFHTSVILNLSWMNNTNTFIYFILYVHHQGRLNGVRKIEPKWPAWIRHLRQQLPGQNKLDHGDNDNGNGGDGAPDHPVPANHGEDSSDSNQDVRGINKIVIGLGSLHLTLMAIIGIWLWSSPAQFESSQPDLIPTSGGSVIPLECTSISLFGQAIQLSSQVLRTCSLVIYGFFLAPILNLIIPTSLFLTLYMGLHGFFGPALHNSRDTGVISVMIGLFFLLLINAVFMIDTELTIHRVHNQQPGESQWTFGQTLALLLLSLPIRDTALLEFYRRDCARLTLQFQEAIEKQDLDAVGQLVRKRRVNVNVTCKKGDFACALQIAAFQGDYPLVRYMVNRHARVNHCGGKYGTALGAAFYAKHELVAQFLLERGATVHSQLGVYPNELDGQTPLHIAVRWGSLPIVRLLLRSGAQLLDALDNRNMTPLHVAVIWAPDIVELLLRAGATPASVAANGETPLHVAVSKGSQRLVRLLLDYSANIDAPTSEGETPLHIAVENRDEAMVTLLIVNNANISAVDVYYESPLHAAIRKGSEPIAWTLLSYGANPNAADGEGKTPLQIANESRHESIVQILLEHGANPVP